MSLKQLWGILSLWPERWCIQGSGILVGCTDEASQSTSCTDTWLLFDCQWSLRLLQNIQLLPWSFWLMMCILVCWSACLVCHILGDHLFRYNLIVCVLGPRLLHLIRLYYHNHKWLSRQCRPHHWLPQKVKYFMFLESLLFDFTFWILLNSRYYPCSTWDTILRVCNWQTSQWFL